MTFMQKVFWLTAVIVNPIMLLIAYGFWAPGYWIVGALGANAIRAINRGAKVAGFYHNTSVGGLSP